MHGKARAFGPPVRRHLDASLVVPDIDTNQLGSFTGEVPRVGTPAEVALRKAGMGMAAAGTAAAFANEGSFGPHPHLYLLPCDHEVAVFIDSAWGIELVESVVSLKTNFASISVRSADELGAFPDKAGFPGHALTVVPEVCNGPWRASTGLVGHDALARAIGEAAALSETGRARVDTDMRAHVNPTRMAVIRAAAARLTLRLATPCPAADCPDGGVCAPSAACPARPAARPPAGCRMRCSAVPAARTSSRCRGPMDAARSHRCIATTAILEALIVRRRP